ncbi:MAG: hypothetical protein IPJ77_18365 [Planctomycetes bacterium]|nr:hypothetical protein [Planctomycetota bacterium]
MQRTRASWTALAAIAFSTSHASAQCPDWKRGLHTNGFTGGNSFAETSAVYDDGSGAELWIGGLFTTIGSTVSPYLAHWDGQQWRSETTWSPNNYIHAMAVYDDGTGPGLYVAGQFFVPVGAVPANGVVRWNGTSWSALGAGLTGDVRAIYSLAVYDDGTGPALYAGGRFALAGGQPANHIARWNGTSWSTLGSGTNDYVFDLCVYDDGTGSALYAGGSFTTAGGQPLPNLARWNGTSWSPPGIAPNGTVMGLGVVDEGSGAALYAGGLFTLAGGQPANHVARWNGSAWSALGSGLDGNVLSFSGFDDGTGFALYAGGQFATSAGQPCPNFARWNGTSWTAPAGGIVGQNVWSTTVFDDGAGPAVYAVGSFDAAGGLRCKGVARYRASGWSAVESGAGFEGTVRALAVHDDDAGASLYAGGQFTYASGFPASNIARSNGASWSALGAGTNGTVHALLGFDDGSGAALYAGGEFTDAGGSGASYLARWNGTSWSAVGGGVDHWVLALCAWDDGTGPALYAAGRLFAAGGGPANSIAKWNGTSWSALGSGMNNWVDELAVHDDGSGLALYASGRFTTAGGGAANRVARWNGTSWSAVGSGMNGNVYTLAAHDAGGGAELYAAGNFSTAGGTGASSIARWNGTSWSPLGLGLTYGTGPGEVFALRPFDGGAGPQLVATGNFGGAGGGLANYIASWNGSSWSNVGAGLGDIGFALAAFDDGTGSGPDLYVGGAFYSAGTIASRGIAEWFGCGPPGVPFCSGDGSASPCPCGSVGASGNGCPNAINPAGANLTATGSADASVDSIVLVGTGMRSSTALYLQGMTRDNGGAGTPLFDGLRCVGGAIVRLAVKLNVNGASQYPDVGNPSVSVRGAVPAGGGARHYQVYYRDAAAAFCPPATANWTNGLTLQWLP